MILDLPNFDSYIHFPLSYGSGKSSRKERLEYDGKKWMIKFNGRNSNLQKKRRNKEMEKYSNSVICEWLGSHIYDICGFPVHNTILGYLNNKIVVACEHLISDTENLQEFKELLKNINEDLFEFFSSGGHLSDIENISEVLNLYSPFKELNMKEHFWDMFVMDAFIGNTDRNLGNFGLILSGTDFFISPIYDNGNSFNCRLTPDGMKNVFANWKMGRNSTILNSSCPYKLDNEAISPLKYIKTSPCKDCINAIERIVPRINLKKCAQPVIDLLETGLINKTQCAFYISSMSIRYKKRLLPAYEQEFGPLISENEINSPQY